MDRTVLITLLNEKTSYNANLQPVTEFTSRKEVYAQMRSISRAEWFEAGRNGLKPDICFVTNCFDYSGETMLEYNGIRYGIYRTYFGRNDSVELYCEKKGGV